MSFYIDLVLRWDIGQIFKPWILKCIDLLSDPIIIILGVIHTHPPLVSCLLKYDNIG